MSSTRGEGKVRVAVGCYNPQYFIILELEQFLQALICGWAKQLPSYMEKWRKSISVLRLGIYSATILTQLKLCMPLSPLASRLRFPTVRIPNSNKRLICRCFNFLDGLEAPILLCHQKKGLRSVPCWRLSGSCHPGSAHFSQAPCLLIGLLSC
jgi:hypothetical protein